MTTIHLTDAQRDQLAATGLIVIDGEPRTDQPRFDGYRAPEGWRILTEPCDTCDGKGVDWSLPHRKMESPVAPGLMVWQPQPCPNPDCIDGRRVVTLTATCPMCPGDQCHDSAVTLGRFTIPALLPVHDADMVPTAEMVKTDAMYVSARLGKCWIDSEYEDDPLLDPLPQPGQFVARPERVE